MLGRASGRSPALTMVPEHKGSFFGRSTATVTARATGLRQRLTYGLMLLLLLLHASFSSVMHAESSAVTVAYGKRSAIPTLPVAYDSTCVGGS